MAALVVALNPCIDVEWRVDDVVWEEKNNLQSERRWAGGKGINVARWLRHLGGMPQLLLPVGGATGDELTGYLRAERFSTELIHLCEPTRANVVVTTNTGRQMRFNPLGPKLSRREWNGILKSVERKLRQLGQLRRAKRDPALAVRRVAAGESKAPSPLRFAGALQILSGSLPRGMPVTAYARLIRLARRFGVSTLLDCDGPAFAAALVARPFLVKPNEHELAQWWRKPLRSEIELVRAACALSRRIRGWVLVSRGGKPSLLINRVEGFQYTARPPKLKPRNTVGAGDALLAAVARQIELGASPEQWLRSGIAAGSAATQLPPGCLPARFEGAVT